MVVLDTIFHVSATHTTPQTVAAARHAWETLKQAGGLVGNAELRERWGSPGSPLSRARVHDLTSQEGFPAPVMRRGQGGDLWLSAEADAWKTAYEERPGRRGPRPRSAAPPAE